MDAKLLAGKIGKYPVYGGVANIATSDMTQLLGATAGLLKVLDVGGAATLGIATLIVSAIIASRNEELRKGSLDNTLIEYSGTGRKFKGFLLDDRIEFICDDQKIIAPLYVVKNIKTTTSCGSGNYKTWYMSIDTIDGSNYHASTEKNQGFFLQNGIREY